MILGILFAAAATAAPVSIPYQGRLADPAGGGVEGPRDLTFTLYDGSGAVVWARTYAQVPVEGGYFAVTLDGTGSAGGVLDSSHFGAATLVGVKVGTDPELSPRHSLGTVPRAAVAMSLQGSTGGGLLLGNATACDTTAATAGTLRFASGRLEICSGGQWKLITTATPGGEGLGLGGDGVRTWSDGAIAKSCYAYRHPTDGVHTYTGATGDGLYRIQPTGFSPFDVWCEMTLESGGWTRVGKFNLNTTGATYDGQSWRVDADHNVAFLNSADNDAVFGAGHLSRAKIAQILLDSNDRRLLSYVKQHSTQQYKYCWNQYSNGVDGNWSFISGPSGSGGLGSCGRFGWGYGANCGVTSTSCSSHDANYTMDAHWMHANGLNAGNIPGTQQIYCGDNSTSGLGSSSAGTGARRGTCTLLAR
jgi:hypothetical protein